MTQPQQPFTPSTAAPISGAVDAAGRASIGASGPPAAHIHTGNTMTALNKLMTRISPEPNSGCWLWDGCVNANGYGVMRVDGRPQLAHRVSYALFVGDPGRSCCHHCDNPSCVNPDHLFAGDQAANNSDMRRKGRAVGNGVRGEAHHRSKLTDAQVAIAKRHKGSATPLARQFNVSPCTINKIRRNPAEGQRR